MSSTHDNFPEDGSTPDLILPKDQIDKMLNLEEEAEKMQAAEEAPKTSGFHPIGKAAKLVEEKKQAQQTVSPEANLDARIKEVEANLRALAAAKGVRLASATNKPPLDYSKLKESDVFDLNIPIEAISHELPDTMLIDLKDPAYIGRWVNISSGNLGMRKAQGFSFVTKEDFGAELILAIEPDENGWYRYNDVVAMKIPKEKWFTALRKTHLRSISMVNQAAAQQVGKRMAEQEIASGKAIDPEGISDPDLQGSRTRDYQRYTAEKKLEVYTPGI